MSRYVSLVYQREVDAAVHAEREAELPLCVEFHRTCVRRSCL